MGDIVRIVTNPRRGRAVVYNGMLFVGGQAADDRTQDVHSQTSQALAKLDRVLADAGTDKTRLLSVQIWLKDITRDFARMNDAWDAWIDADTAPARATAECEMGAEDVLVEIIATAAVAPLAIFRTSRSLAPCNRCLTMSAIRNDHAVLAHNL